MGFALSVKGDRALGAIQAGQKLQRLTAITGQLTEDFNMAGHWRDDMIVLVDEQIAQPVVSTMNKDNML